MFTVIDPIIEILLAFLSITIISSFVSAFAYYGYYKLIKNFSGYRKASSIFSYTLLAPIVGFWSTTLLVSPPLSDLIIPQHCHDDVCSAHPPSVALHSVIGGGFALLATVLIIGFIILFYFSWQKYQRKLFTLEKLSNLTANNQYNLIDNPALLAWNAGLWRTKIFISQGLKSALSPEELAVIVAHETYHSLNHDNLRKLVLRWLTKIWLINKSTIRDDFELACEQACDVYAAKQVASVEQVINTIKKYMALTQTTTTTTEDKESAQRIQLLLQHLKQKSLIDEVTPPLLFLNNKAISVLILLSAWFVVLFGQIVLFTMAYHLGLDHFFIS